MYNMEELIYQFSQIDYMSFLKFLNPVILYYVGSKVINKYKINKQFNPKAFKVSLPPELVRTNSDEEILTSLEPTIDEKIEKFSNIITNFVSKEYLINFYNNIRDLKLKQKKLNPKSKILDSSYDVTNNSLNVDIDIDEYVIYHELLHMASSIYQNGIVYSGFNQASFNPADGIVNVGVGLNEGYTELLNKTYFSQEKEISTSEEYYYLTFIADRLKEVLGEDVMNKYYFSADLSGLMNELSKYMPKEHVERFIIDTDFIFNHIGNKKSVVFERGKIEFCLKNINSFLIICLYNKLSSELNDEKILFDKLFDYIETLPFEVKVFKHSYKLLTYDETIKYLKNYIVNNSLNNNEYSQDIKGKQK